MKEFDIIIIGAGCSGLSLAYRLIDTPFSVCVIENKKVMTESEKHGHIGMYIIIPLSI